MGCPGVMVVKVLESERIPDMFENVAQNVLIFGN